MEFINVHVLQVSHSGEKVDEVASDLAIFLIESDNQQVGKFPAEGLQMQFVLRREEGGIFPII